MEGELEMEDSVLTHPLNPSFKLGDDGGASRAPSDLARSHAGWRNPGTDRSGKSFQIRNGSKDSSSDS